MKNKFLLVGALMAGCAFSAFADGYTDGIEYYKASQFKNARTVLERTLNDANTDKALSYYYLGQISMTNGDVQTAKADFDKGVAANAECPYNYVGLGAVALRGGDKKTAEEYFKTAQKLGKKNYEILVDIARAYYNTDPTKYATEVSKFLEKAHKDSKHKEPAIYILEGDMLFDQKQLGDAAAKYEQAISFDQDNPEGYVKFATAYMGVNPQFTIEKLEELLAKQPNSALAQRELAERYYENNQWTKAAEQYAAYMSNPNHFPEDKARYLVLIYANSDYPKAIQVADELLAVDPNSAQALRVKMLAQEETGDMNGAKETAERFFSLKYDDPSKAPFNQSDYASYGNILASLGDAAGAEAAYLKAIELDPTKLDNYKLLSTIYTNSEQFQKAADILAQAIEPVGEGFSLTEYYTLSSRYLNASSKAEDPAVSASDAAKGLDAVNVVIEKAAEVQPAYLQRKAVLTLLKNNKEVNQEVAEAYLALKNALDQDPANMDPANENNRRSWYKQVYQILTKYYMDLGEKEKSDEMYNKFNELNQ